jgi:hypothetical protein
MGLCFQDTCDHRMSFRTLCFRHSTLWVTVEQSLMRMSGVIREPCAKGKSGPWGKPANRVYRFRGLPRHPLGRHRFDEGPARLGDAASLISGVQTDLSADESPCVSPPPGALRNTVDRPRHSGSARSCRCSAPLTQGWRPPTRRASFRRPVSDSPGR